MGTGMGTGTNLRTRGKTRTKPAQNLHKTRGYTCTRNIH
jgi:hypothetical protein